MIAKGKRRQVISQAVRYAMDCNNTDTYVSLRCQFILLGVEVGGMTDSMHGLLEEGGSGWRGGV